MQKERPRHSEVWVPGPSEQRQGQAPGRDPKPSKPVMSSAHTWLCCFKPFFCSPVQNPVSFFFLSLHWMTKGKRFLNSIKSSVSPGSWQCTSRDTEQRRGICATAWAFCSTSAILIPQLVSHSSRVTQLGDFKWFTRKRSSLFCVVLSELHWL